MMTPTVATDKQLKLFKMLLLVDQMRGEHATGIAKVNRLTNTVAVHKRALNAVDFLSEEATKEFLDKDRGHIYIGHNRYATMGSRDDSGAHPFQTDHITMVHNGTVDHHALHRLSKHGDKNVTVDSEMVCHTIAEHGISKAVKDHFSGAFSLVWWNDVERSLNFARNKERPMYHAFLSDGTFVWASEPEFIDLVIERDKVWGYSKDGEPGETLVDHHYCWKFTADGKFENKGRPTLRKLEFKRQPFVVTQRSSAYDAWADYYGDTEEKDTWGVNSFRNKGRGYANVTPINRDIIKSQDGINLGSQGYVDGRNETLKSWGSPWKLGDRFAFMYQTHESNAYQLSQNAVTMIGTSDHPTLKDAEIRSVSQDRKDLFKEDGKPYTRYVGTIVGCFEQTSYLLGVKSVKKIITVDNTRVSPVDPDLAQTTVTLVPAKQQVVQYPLKVNGKTFADSEQFKDFVSCGCSLCGNVPVPYDSRNTQMTAYPEKNEFICGGCEIDQLKKTMTLKV